MNNSGILPVIAAISVVLLGSTAYADPIIFTDQVDREITLNSVPERIVAAATPAGSMVITLAQQADILVGTSSGSLSAMKEGVMNEFFPFIDTGTNDLLSASGSANIEEILRLEPDLIIQWGFRSESIEALEAAGLKVAGLNYTHFDLAKNWLTDIGIMLDQSPRAAEILAWHEKRFAEIIALTDTIAEDDKPTVMYLRGEARATGPLSHFNYWIESAGAKNAITAEVKFVDLDPEMVLTADPDVIWLLGYEKDMTPDFIYNNPLYADVKAVQNHRIYKVPVGADRWDIPNQEAPLSMEWFTRTIHPELLGGTMRDSIREIYPLLYGQTPTDEQMDIMLRLEENGKAQNYDLVIR